MLNVRRTPRYTAPAIVFIIAAFVLAGLFFLNRAAYQSQQAEAALLRAQTAANEISANEWQMIAEQELNPDLAANLQATRDRISQLLKDAALLDPNNAELQNAQTILVKYFLALDQEIQLVKSGKIDEAKLADSEQVDPVFSQLKDSLASAVAGYSQRLNQVQAGVNTGSFILILGGSLLIGIVLSQNQQARFKADLMNVENKTLTQTVEQGKELAIHTAALDRINTQLLASSRVVQQVVAIHDMGALLNNVVELITGQLGFYHCGIFLLDEQNNYAVLQSASSQGGRRMLESGYRLKVGEEGLVGRAAKEKKTLVTLDADSDANYSKNPDLPETRSEIAFPLVVGGKIIGVLDIQSKQAQAFAKGDANILQILADQLALVMENVRLLSDAQVIAGQLEFQMGQQTQQSWKVFATQRAIAFQYTPTGVKPIVSGATPMDNGSLRIPLILRGQEIGSIALQRKDSTHWTSAEHDLAEKVAAQTALALENSRLLEETRRRASQEQTVNEISARLGRSLDIDTLLQTAARELGSLPDVAEVSVYIEPLGNKEPER